MKKSEFAILRFWAGIILLVNLGARAVFADIFIVHNADIQIETKDVKDIFIGDKTQIEGKKIIVALSKFSIKEFVKNVFALDEDRYNYHWTRKSFREGLPQPKNFVTDADLIVFIKATPHSVGFVSNPVSKEEATNLRFFKLNL